MDYRNLRSRKKASRWPMLPFGAMLLAFAYVLLGPQTAAQAQEPTPALLYSTYLGGASDDQGKGVAVDAEGNIYVLGETYSGDILDVGATIKGYTDLFVAKFSPDGSELLYFTTIGSDDSDHATTLRVDAQGNAYVTGSVYDTTFPTTPNALWPQPLESTNGFLFKLDGNGDLVYSTYLPLDVFDAKQNLAVDSEGNAYVTGSYPWVQTGDDYWRSQIAVLKISPDGSELLLDESIGGHGTDKGTAIAVDDAGNIYIAGLTESVDDFPVTPGAHQAQCGDLIYEPDSYCYRDSVIVVMNAQGEVTYSSFHGGDSSDEPLAIMTDGNGLVAIVGNTNSSQFPLANAFQDECPQDPSYGGCFQFRTFVSAIRIVDGKGTLAYSTYLGSRERESSNSAYTAAMDRAGNTYVAGYTNGKFFPLQDPIQPQLNESFCYTFSSVRYCFDAFLTKFSPTGDVLFSTYLGATFDDYPYALAVNDAGIVYVVGTTEADDFPITADAYQPTMLIGDDAFLMIIRTGETPVPANVNGSNTGEPNSTSSASVAATTNPQSHVPLISPDVWARLWPLPFWAH